MNFLINLLVPGNKRSVRIRPDYLPGLNPPKAAPFKPARTQKHEIQVTDIDELYKRFLARSPMPGLKRIGNRKGFEL
jgi:hypothetical protein